MTKISRTHSLALAALLALPLAAWAMPGGHDHGACQGHAQAAAGAPAQADPHAAHRQGADAGAKAPAAQAGAGCDQHMASMQGHGRGGMHAGMHGRMQGHMSGGHMGGGHMGGGHMGSHRGMHGAPDAGAPAGR